MIHRPAVIGEDVCAMVRVGGNSWGHFSLYRELSSRNFGATERAFIAGIGAEIAVGLRRSLSRGREPGSASLARLHNSPYTLHDHVRPIVGKPGTRSRSELMPLGTDTAYAEGDSR